MRRTILTLGLAAAVALGCSTAFAQRGGGEARGNAGRAVEGTVGNAGNAAGKAVGNAPATVNRAPAVVNPNVNSNVRVNPNLQANPNVQVDRGREFSNRSEDWRYHQNNGYWWYWTPLNRWMYYTNGNWAYYDDAGYSGAYTTGYGSDPNEQFYNGYWWYWTGNGWLYWDGSQWVASGSYATYHTR
jgi:hypothetical protein